MKKYIITYTQTGDRYGEIQRDDIQARTAEEAAAEWEEWARCQMEAEGLPYDCEIIDIEEAA